MTSVVGRPGSDSTRTSAGADGPAGGSAALTSAAAIRPVAKPNRRARPTVMGAPVYQFDPSLARRFTSGSPTPKERVRLADEEERARDQDDAVGAVVATRVRDRVGGRLDGLGGTRPPTAVDDPRRIEAAPAHARRDHAGDVRNERVDHAPPALSAMTAKTSVVAAAERRQLAHERRDAVGLCAPSTTTRGAARRRSARRPGHRVAREAVAHGVHADRERVPCRGQHRERGPERLSRWKAARHPEREAVPGDAEATET
jgi:hypothetical protein